MIGLFAAAAAAVAVYATPLSNLELQQITDAAAQNANTIYKSQGTTGLEIAVQGCYAKLSKPYKSTAIARCLALDRIARSLDGMMGEKFERDYFKDETYSPRVLAAIDRMHFASQEDAQLFVDRLVRMANESERHLVEALQ